MIQKRIEDKLFKDKVVIIYGPRQAGKTTLIQEIQKNYLEQSVLLNCDEPDIRDALTNKSSTELFAYIGNKRLVLIDEAQRVKNIGLTLKLLVDTKPEMQVLATGSSSFDLSNEIVEPLTGRAYEFILYPLSWSELANTHSVIELDRLLARRMVFGMYPEIVQNEHEAETLLKTITRSYLYKDVLQYQRLKHPDVLEKLVKALALQIGNEVSYTELATLVGIDKKTVETYVGLLEKTFVIYRLTPFSRNARNELKKMRKIYFYDLGIRNALINNLNPLDLRQDTGGLWESFLITERMKLLHNAGNDPGRYFWRTHQGSEIDYIEEQNGKRSAFEFKWGAKKARPPKTFQDAYPGSLFTVINRNNYQDFITSG